MNININCQDVKKENAQFYIFEKQKKIFIFDSCFIMLLMNLPKHDCKIFVCI